MRIVETPIRAWAHCSDPLCPGGLQEEVDGISTLRERTYWESAGNEGPPSKNFENPLGPYTETSWITISFANEDDAPCPECGQPREITDQVRPVYESRIFDTHGKPFPQDALLELRRHGKITPPADGAAQADPRIAALEAQVQTLTTLLGERLAEPPTKAPRAASAGKG